MVHTEDLKEQIRQFWDSRPCDAERSTKPIGSREFFDEIRAWRYQYEHHIPSFAQFERWKDQKILEIGVGVGADAYSFAKNGARIHGLDVSPRALEITRQHLNCYGYDGDLQVGDAECNPWPDNYFDLVYSFGVLLCIPNIVRAVAEVHRVLKPGGVAKVMLYYRPSYNYWINIRLFRRLGLGLLNLPGGTRFVSALTGQPLKTMETYRQLFRDNPQYTPQFFLNQNTDGPGNPYTSVYSKREGQELFREFAEIEQRVYFLNKRYVPLLGRVIPPSIENLFARAVGWHLCITARK